MRPAGTDFFVRLCAKTVGGENGAILGIALIPGQPLNLPLL